MSRKYSADDILQMAVGKLKADMAADLDNDGKITSADSRLARRSEGGLSPAQDTSTASGAAASVLENFKKDSTSSGVNGSASGNTDGSASGIKPEYQPSALYTDASKELLNSLLENKEFSYDFNADPLYKLYSATLTSAGRDAAEDVYGIAATKTGGMGNSYAASVASQAYNSYLSQLSSLAGELEGKAYSRYQDAADAKSKLLNTLTNMESSDYSRYRDSVSDYYKDTENAEDSLSFVTEFAFDSAKQGDYSYLEALGVDTSAMRKNAKTEYAVTLAENGDYSALEALGVDITALEYLSLLSTAQTAAKYGDYSYLNALGFNTEKAETDSMLEKALAFAKYGDYSLLGELGAVINPEKNKISSSVLTAAEKSYSSGGLSALKTYLQRLLSYGSITQEEMDRIISALAA